MPSFVYHGEFTCISERWTIRSRCFNVNTSVKGVTPSHPTPAQEWQWGQEPLAWGWQPERPPPHLCCWAGAQWAGPPVPGPHHAHFRENMRPLLAFVFVLMDVGRKFFIPEQKQQTHSCCTGVSIFLNCPHSPAGDCEDGCVPCLELSPWKQLLLARVLSWLHHPLADTHFPETLGSRPQPRSAPADTLVHRLVKVGSPAPSPPGPTDAWIPPQIRGQQNLQRCASSFLWQPPTLLEPPPGVPPSGQDPASPTHACPLRAPRPPGAEARAAQPGPVSGTVGQPRAA